MANLGQKLPLLKPSFFEFFNISMSTMNTSDERPHHIYKSVEDLGFEKKLIDILEKESGRKPELLYVTYCDHDFFEEVVPKRGLTFCSVSFKEAQRIVRAFISDFEKNGYLLFFTNITSYYDQKTSLVDIALIEGRDQKDILRILRTGNTTNKDDDENYAVRQVREWEEMATIRIIGATHCAAIIDFEEVPDNIDSLVRTLYGMNQPIGRYDINKLKKLEDRIRKEKQIIPSFCFY